MLHTEWLRLDGSVASIQAKSRSYSLSSILRQGINTHAIMNRNKEFKKIYRYKMSHIGIWSLFLITSHADYEPVVKIQI